VEGRRMAVRMERGNIISPIHKKREKIKLGITEELH